MTDLTDHTIEEIIEYLTVWAKQGKATFAEIRMMPELTKSLLSHLSGYLLILEAENQHNHLMQLLQEEND